jgi:hypothetical protein
MGRGRLTSSTRDEPTFAANTDLQPDFPMNAQNRSLLWRVVRDPRDLLYLIVTAIGIIATVAWWVTLGLWSIKALAFFLGSIGSVVG